LRPDESSSFQTLGKQAQTITVPPQELYDIASAPAKHEEMPATLHPSRFCLSSRLFIRFFMAIFFP
jgi:hypothetical protein